MTEELYCERGPDGVWRPARRPTMFVAMSGVVALGILGLAAAKAGARFARGLVDGLQ